MIGAMKQMDFDGQPGTFVNIFTSNSSWTAPSNISSATLLLIGGGGGGGNVRSAAGDFTCGGGGGAGGIRANVNVLANITAGTTYTITIGTGGNAGYTIGANANTYLGANGSPSIAFGYTAAGGAGGGGGGDNQNARSGGSGGGGGYASSLISGGTQGSNGQGNIPNTTPAQGYNGSTGDQLFSGPSAVVAGSSSGGGGGGNAVAINGYVQYDVLYNITSYAAGQGGAGIYDIITGSNVLYAVGGNGTVSAPGITVSSTAPTAAGSGGNGGLYNSDSSTRINPTAGINGIAVLQYTIS